MNFIYIKIFQSPVKHLFQPNELVFEIFILFVLSIDGGNIPCVPDPSIVCCFKLPLIMFNFFSQLSSLGFYFPNLPFNFLLGHLCASTEGDIFFKFLVINVQRSERLFLIVVWLIFEKLIKIVVIHSELVFHFLFLIGKTVNIHPIYISIKVSFFLH